MSPEFEAFLMRAKDDSALQNTRFVARNFLLEERLAPARAESYAANLTETRPTNMDEWHVAHATYLSRHIFIRPHGRHDYRFVPPDNPDVCPETFRAGSALIAFQNTDLDTHLIRVIPVADLARMAKRDEARIYSLGEQVASGARINNPAREELALIFEEAFVGARCDHRPVFAAFYEDFLDELREHGDGSWPNRIRDRMGLYHINQWQAGGLPRRVFLFRYPVRDIPYHPAHPERRPLAVPSVLDHRLSEWFCPAPRELDRGRLLNLQADAVEEPAREVLHLFMPMKVEHLFRVGLVTTPVPENLSQARRDHLLWLRLQAEREDYASATDEDLFRL